MGDFEVHYDLESLRAQASTALFHEIETLIHQHEGYQCIIENYDRATDGTETIEVGFICFPPDFYCIKVTKTGDVYVNRN